MMTTRCNYSWRGGLHKSGQALTAVFLLSLLVSYAAEPDNLWPRYRHDAALTGFSPLKGGLAQAPKVLWTVDLGGPSVAAEQVRLDDFNGDGHDELLRILP